MTAAQLVRAMLQANVDPDVELVFDDHGSFKAVRSVKVTNGKLIFVLEPHAEVEPNG